MTSTQWLIVIYKAYPLAFFIDFVVLQVALRLSYWRSNSRLRSSGSA